MPRLGGAAVVLAVAPGIMIHVPWVVLVTVGPLVFAVGALQLYVGLRARNRQLDEDLRLAQPGTLFAAPATQARTLTEPAQAAGGPGPGAPGSAGLGARAPRGPWARGGQFLLDRTGISFTPAAGVNGLSRTILTWEELTRMEVTPCGPQGARVRVTTASGDSMTWVCAGMPKLVGALGRLQEDQLEEDQERG